MGGGGGRELVKLRGKKLIISKQQPSVIITHVLNECMKTTAHLLWRRFHIVEGKDTDLPVALACNMSRIRWQQSILIFGKKYHKFRSAEFF